jgi:chromosome segregation ATPase
MSNSNIRSRALSAILMHALFRFESAATIAGTILLLYFFPQPFAWWQWWYWLILGGVAEALIVYTSIKDEQTGAAVVAELFRAEFNPATIRSQKYRGALERALTYRTRIEELIRKSDAGVLQQHLQETTQGIGDWLAQIFRLAQRLDEYERDDMLKQDLTATPATLRQLNDRVRQANNEAVREQARRTLASKQAQWDNLQKLAHTMEQAELQLEATLTALGTVYSQLVLLNSKDEVSDSRARRLRDDIAEQVSQLNDLQAAMDEVYQGK